MRSSHPLLSIFTKNLPLKLLSVVIATGLYLAISSQPITEVGLMVPLEYRNIPANLEITSLQAPQVHVRVRGPADEVRRASQTDIVAYIDLAGASAGSHTYDLDHGAVRAPYGLSIVDLYPSQFRLNLEPRSSREVPVAVRLVGVPASGFRVTGYSITPGKVRIIGPESRVQQMASAVTDPVDVSGLSRDTTLSTRVFVPNAQVRLLSRNSVEVTVHIEREPASQPTASTPPLHPAPAPQPPRRAPAPR